MRFGFLGIYGSAVGPTGLRGGVMVTDEYGIPLEIRVAESVRADLMQRRAYRETLQRHAIRDLTTAPLLNSLQLQPDFVFANNLQCLDATSAVPLMFVAEAETLVMAGDYLVEKTSRHSDHTQLAIVFRSTAERRVIEAAVEGIESAQQSFEPLGVFERISDVIGLLSGNDARFA